MNARDRKNHVDDTLDNLILITSELREEVKEMAITSDKKIQELHNENVVLRRTLNEILDVSLRLRSHTPYSGQEIGIGNAAGGFVLQIADEPMIRSFPADPTPPPTTPPTPSSSHIVGASTSYGNTNNNNDRSTTATPLQSSYDFHHEHHQLGHPEHQEDFVLIDQTTTPVPSAEQAKKSRWDSLTFSWPSSGSSTGPSSSPSAA